MSEVEKPRYPAERPEAVQGKPANCSSMAAGQLARFNREHGLFADFLHPFPCQRLAAVDHKCAGSKDRCCIHWSDR